MNALKLTRPEPIEFTLADGRCFIVEPATRAQMREALSLDPVGDEPISPTEASAQRALQLEALVGATVQMVTNEGGEETLTPAASGPLLGSLTAHEEGQILTALIAQAHGLDAAGAVALDKLSKKKGVLDVLAGLQDSTPTPTNSPSPSTSHPGTPNGSDSSTP